MNPTNKIYDLEERTAIFGEKIIRFCKKIKYNPINTPLISQIVRSSTSGGANYTEANGAISRNEFRHKIYICKKEIQETKHWIRVIIASEPELESDSLNLSK